MAAMDRQDRRSIMELAGDALSHRIFRLMRRRASRREDFAKLVVPIDDVIGIRIAATGRFELTQVDAIGSILNHSYDTLGLTIDRTGCFVDIGANIGLYTLAFSRYFRQTLAFEPNPVTFKLLEANIALRELDSVRTFNEGLSDSSGESSLFVPKNGNLGWATMNRSHHDISVSETRISVRRLDDILASETWDGLPSVSLIKLDVEGHEPAVLRGAQSLLRRDGPVILFEALNATAGDACVDVLRGCGYGRYFTFKRKLGGSRGGIGGYLDSLFNGLPVVVSEIDAREIQRNALICAMRARAPHMTLSSREAGLGLSE